MNWRVSNWLGFARQSFSLDLRSLALLRICLALLTLVDLASRARFLTAHYTELGVMPIGALADRYRFDVYLFAETSWQVASLMLLHAAFALCLLVGYRTRLATILCWIMLVSLQNRNPFLINAGDTLFRLLFFWGMFLPLGARWAVDCLRQRRTWPQQSYLSSATVGYVFQICLVYWFTFAFKTSPQWWQGEALHYVLNSGEFTTHWGVWLRQFKTVLPALTYGVLYWELLGTLLLFVPYRQGFFRLLSVAGFIALHFGMYLFMNLAMFPLVCIAAWLCMLPSFFWDKLLPKLSFRSQNRVAIVAVRSRPQAAEPELTGVPTSSAVNKFGGILAGLLCVYILAWNIRSLDMKRLGPYFPPYFNFVGQLLRIDQKWTMFSPGVPTNNVWFVMAAELQNGEMIDLLNFGRPLTWDKPLVLVDRIPSRRWSKYLSNLRVPKNSDHRVHYALYLARSWNETHAEDDKIIALTFYEMVESIDHPSESPKKIILFEAG